MGTVSFKEDHISQVPVLQLLGYRYLTPDEANIARGRRSSNVILDSVLEAQLKALNKISFKLACL